MLNPLRKFLPVFKYLFLLTLPWMALGIEDDPIAPTLDPAKKNPPAAPPAPVSVDRVDWGALLRQSGHFLAIQHGVRVATEPGTREGLQGSYFRGYVSSVANMHGWSDGDGFLVNYIGHPIQGAVATYIWRQNDPRYRTVEFGRSREYWRGLMRATGFSAIYSSQFELGLISEASIGQIQRRYPQQGFVDHVITPALGLGWTVAEDWLDKALIKKIETATTQRWVRLLVRGGLNPSRSFANMMAGKVPWHRDTRPGVLAYDAVQFERHRRELSGAAIEHRAGPPPGVAPFEFGLMAQGRPAGGDQSGQASVGGGAEMAFRIGPQWQLLAEVSGSTRLGFDWGQSGDSISVLIGPRWTPTTGRWQPYLQFLAGGTKITTETIDLARQAALREQLGVSRLPSEWYDRYARRDDLASFALKAGGGVHFKVNEAVALKLAGIDYVQTWLNDPLAPQAGTGLQIGAGVVLRFGSW